MDFANNDDVYVAFVSCSNSIQFVSSLEPYVLKSPGTLTGYEGLSVIPYFET